MKEIKGELWSYYDTGHIICITTNGMIKKNGEVVMGRGCAFETKMKIPSFPKELGEMIKAKGNAVHYFPDYRIITFPVKHNWYENADIALIQNSAFQLKQFIETRCPVLPIILPRPGCGNGHLDWETQVRPAISRILSDEVLVISNEQ